ncbi:MAG: thiolase family protein [Hyphomicrobiaceae bacterium]
MAKNYLENKDVCIVAYGETKIDRATGKTAYELAAEVAEELFAKTKLKPKDIDGVGFTVPMSECSNPFWSNYCTDYLGIETRWLQTTDLGGASAIGNVARASMALQNDLCETVMLIGTDAPSTKWSAIYGGYRNQFWEPTGIQGPPGAFGLLYQRYMAQHDLDFRGLGALAVAQRNGAAVNDLAYEKFRKRITVDDYLNSRLVSTPLRLLDSVMFCDGANGVVMMKTERARKLGFTNLVYPIAYSEVSNFDVANQTPDITISGFSKSGPDALAKAGLKPSDISMFHPYDDFLIAVMLKLEQIGFCKKGEGSQFLRDTDLSPTGQLPINTGGGQIGCGQPGLAGGGVNLVEAVRQLMGEAKGRQVPDPKNAMVTGIGVIPYGRNWGTSNVLIVSK